MSNIEILAFILKGTMERVQSLEEEVSRLKENEVKEAEDYNFERLLDG